MHSLSNFLLYVLATGADQCRQLSGVFELGFEPLWPAPLRSSFESQWPGAARGEQRFGKESKLAISIHVFSSPRFSVNTSTIFNNHVLFSEWYLKDPLAFSCSTEACTTGGGHHDCWMRFDPNQKQGALPFDQSAMHLDQLASAVWHANYVWLLLDCVVSPGCLSQM